MQNNIQTLITNSFDPETGIITAVFSGEVDVDEVVEWARGITPEKYPVKKLKVLLNATQVKYPFQRDQYYRIDEANELVATLFEQFCFARVHHKPTETAISELVHSHKHPENYFTELFSHEANAMKWLLSM